MKIAFFKYQGAGNDFVIIDNRQGVFPTENFGLVRRICDRKFGIGADGLMLLENDPNTDFKMNYYNANGNPGSMCGNGGRCIVAFAKSLGIIEDETSFKALGEVYKANFSGLEVNLNMMDVNEIDVFDDHVFLDTGSPHHVEFIENIRDFNVVDEGRRIRNAAPYNEAGSNVNFVEKLGDNTFSVRTYERGVEDETLSCGTGVTAVALASYHLDKTSEKTVNIVTPGGDLKIQFEKEDGVYKNIVLTGPATFVFNGTIDL